jgi:hypothetical protein
MSVDLDRLKAEVERRYDEMRRHRDARAAAGNRRMAKASDGEVWALAKAMIAGEELDRRWTAWQAGESYDDVARMQNLLHEAETEVRSFPHLKRWGYRDVQARRREREQREVSPASAATGHLPAGPAADSRPPSRGPAS